ncbi:MAG: hypothetical protein ACFB51_12970 [Anaerolineae bacterium]
MRIAVLANLKKNAPSLPTMSPDQRDDLDSEATINHILNALEAGGHSAAFFEANINPPHDLIEALRGYGPDLCFNIAEGHTGDGREAQIPAMLEMLRLPYTGSRVLTLALTLDKPMTKRVLMYHGLPSAEFQVFDHPDDPLDDDLLDADGSLRFPMFVKPSREGTGMGVAASSIVHTIEDLRERVAAQIAAYEQPILAERYIRGRELTVGVVGNLGPTAARRTAAFTAPAVLPDELTFFPPLEIKLDAYPESEAGLYTNRMKEEWVDDWHYLCQAPVDADLLDRLNRLTAAVFRVTGWLDVARVDFRLDADRDNEPVILEVNPLPGLNPVYSDLCVEARAAGWSYEQLITTIVELAAERWALRVKL